MNSVSEQTQEFIHLVELHLAAIEELREVVGIDAELDNIHCEIVDWAIAKMGGMS